MKTSHEVNGVNVANFFIDEISANDLREIVTSVRGQLGQVANVVVGAGVFENKVNVVVATSELARTKNFNAGNILKAILEKLDGKGGGKADMAQGAGSNVLEAKSLISKIDSFIK